jgi:NADH:ubiquinone oxidoreductase subunit 2 (subunit N)
MLGFMAAGFMTVLCIFMLMARTDMRKWLGYSNIVDVSFTIIMIAMFHDTFSGVVSAACAGVFMSTGLWTLRKSMGCKKLRKQGFKLVWVYCPPTWRTGNAKASVDNFSFTA